MARPARRDVEEALLNSDILKTYLNDHLAGSIAALELVEHLVSKSRGTDLEKWFLTLGAEIEEDHETLCRLIKEVGGKESRARNAGAWLAEKFAEIKLNVDDTGTGQLRLLEALETLGLGIQGKLGLWRALEAASAHTSQVGHLDLPTLQQRARDQFDRVESQRLRVARAALGA